MQLFKRITVQRKLKIEYYYNGTILRDKFNAWINFMSDEREKLINQWEKYNSSVGKFNYIS